MEEAGTARNSMDIFDPETRPDEDEIDFDLIELLYFAYRDFTSDPDHMLAELDFGRAHHRVLHFCTRRPGLTVAELLDVLQITKQSLARVLKQLIETDHIIQIQRDSDRRQRELHPTQKGIDLALSLAKPQSRRIESALKQVDQGNRVAIEQFLRGMCDPQSRTQIAEPHHGSTARIGTRQAD